MYFNLQPYHFPSAGQFFHTHSVYGFLRGGDVIQWFIHSTLNTREEGSNPKPGINILWQYTNPLNMPLSIQVKMCTWQMLGW